MAINRRYTRPRFTLLLLVLTAITLLTLEKRNDSSGAIVTIKSAARDIFAPIESVGDGIVSPVANFFQGMFNYGDLKAENARLREQVQAAESAKLRAADAERERRELLDLQDLDFTGDIPSVAARVVSSSGSNFELTVEINKGTKSGLTEDMPVVAASGLVGRVSEVSAKRATVLLLSDPTSNVGIRLASSGDVGVASGTGREKSLQGDLIEAATVTKPNEAVVTSGLDQSLYPPGIPVGKIDRPSRLKPGALQRQIEIDPVVDFRGLTFVRVLLWDPAG